MITFTTFEETFTQFIKAMKITYAYVNLVVNFFCRSCGKLLSRTNKLKTTSQDKGIFQLEPITIGKLILGKIPDRNNNSGKNP